MSSRALTPAEVPRFDVAQAVTPVGTAPCAECRAAIVDTYFEWDGKVICATCQPRIAQFMMSLRRGNMGRALGLGILAAVASGAMYHAATALAGRDITVALLVVGFVIGKAVRVGSDGRGGRRYQWLAAGLTYATIASTYVPLVTTGFGTYSPAPAVAAAPMHEPAVAEAPSTGAAHGAGPSNPVGTTALPSSRPTFAHLAALLLLAGAAPVLTGFSDITSIAITSLGVLIAWRMNRALPAAIAGPFRVMAEARQGIGA
jgi:hypothetical protein